MAITAPCKLNFIVFLWLCLALPSILATRIKYCDRRANYAVKVKEVEISPNPLKGGEPSVFSIYASTGENLSGGNVEIEVSYFGIRVHSETIELCKETPCPVAAGNFVLSHSQELPVYTPPGSYTLKMRILDNNEQQLTCISFAFKIGFGSSVSDV